LERVFQVFELLVCLVASGLGAHPDVFHGGKNVSNAQRWWHNVQDDDAALEQTSQLDGGIGDPVRYGGKINRGEDSFHDKGGLIEFGDGHRQPVRIDDGRGPDGVRGSDEFG
jgi:hypothetical protein